MNKHWTLFLIVVCLCGFGSAQEIYLSRDQRPTEVRILEDHIISRFQSTLTLECHLQSLSTLEVDTPEGKFTRLYVPGWQHTYRVGEPELPRLSKLVEVPLGGALEVKVVSSNLLEDEMRAYQLNGPLYPTQPSVRKDEKEVAFSYRREAYQQAYRGEAIVEVEELGILRDSRLALVHFKPVEYNPAEKRIKIHNDIQAELTIHEADLEKTAEMKRMYRCAYFGGMKNRVLRPESLRGMARAREEKKYLLIAAPLFRENHRLREFVAWKESLGFEVSLVYTDEIEGGATTDAIAAYIKAQYESPEDGIPPTFLLLVGDHEQIPGHKKDAPDRGSYHYTDLYYCTMTAGDYLPDILYGRFSAKTHEDLDPQIQKTISYEKKDFLDKDFLKRYALVAGWDGSWAVKRGYPQIRYSITEYFREPAYLQAIDTDGAPDQNVFLSKRSGHSSDKIFALVNKGVCFFNYTAHGDETSFADPSFTMADIDRLENRGQYPLVVGNCCLTGSFQVDTCFGEKWLRVADKGAIGYIGGSNYTYWDEDLWFGVGYCALTSSVNSGTAPEKSETGVGMYDAAFDRLHKGCNAGVMLAGNLAVLESPNSSLKEYYFQVYHLFGDPSLEPIWANPEQTPAPVYPFKVFEADLPTPLDIPDNNAQGIEIAMKLDETIAPVNLDVYLDITHTYIGDLTVTLAHQPTGKSMVVREKIGGGNDNIQGWQGKTTLFNGIDTQGEWVLLVKDTASGDAGKLNGWKVKIYYREN